jgi:hypothetical protein
LPSNSLQDVLFLKKKNQKDFALGAPDRHADEVKPWFDLIGMEVGRLQSKSFLLLFFKKEALSSYSAGVPVTASEAACFFING